MVPCLCCWRKALKIFRHCSHIVCVQRVEVGPVVAKQGASQGRGSSRNRFGRIFVRLVRRHTRLFHTRAVRHFAKDSTQTSQYSRSPSCEQAMGPLPSSLMPRMLTLSAASSQVSSRVSAEADRGMPERHATSRSKSETKPLEPWCGAGP